MQQRQVNATGHKQGQSGGWVSGLSENQFSWMAVNVRIRCRDGVSYAGMALHSTRSGLRRGRWYGCWFKGSGWRRGAAALAPRLLTGSCLSCCLLLGQRLQLVFVLRQALPHLQAQRQRVEKHSSRLAGATEPLFYSRKHTQQIQAPPYRHMPTAGPPFARIRRCAAARQCAACRCPPHRRTACPARDASAMEGEVCNLEPPSGVKSSPME